LPRDNAQLNGEANDYIGQRPFGGTNPLSLRGLLLQGVRRSCGNTVLYGATSGQLFIAGRAGSVSLSDTSGALAVVKCWPHGCEYMTAA